MALDLKANIRTGQDSNSITLSRTISSGDTDKGQLQICITSPSGQVISCSVDPLDFLNSAKAIFPELLITLPS